MLSTEAFSLGNKLVHVQAVPGSSIDCPVVTPRHNNVRVRTKHGPGVHGPPLWTGSMDHFHGPPVMDQVHGQFFFLFL